MSSEVCILFVFHVKKVECVSPEEAARIRSRGPASGLRLGPNDQWSPIDIELHASPVLDHLIRQARRQDAIKREAAADRARIGRALANAAYLPKDIPPGASRLAAALYQNILPPRQATSPTASASTGDEPQPDATVPASQALSRPAQSFYRTLGIVRRTPSTGTGSSSAASTTSRASEQTRDGASGPPTNGNKVSLSAVADMHPLDGS